MRDARRAQYIAQDREIRALEENLQQGRITIREFLIAAAFNFEPSEEVFPIEELVELVLLVNEARAVFHAVLEIPAPIHEELNDEAGIAAGEGVDPVPPLQDLPAPPLQEVPVPPVLDIPPSPQLQNVPVSQMVVEGLVAVRNVA